MTKGWDRLEFDPREAVQGTRVSSWWIRGSRDRYGEAYFAVEGTRFMRDGSERPFTTIWRNHRPYAPNQPVAEIDVRRAELTWDDLGAALDS